MLAPSMLELTTLQALRQLFPFLSELNEPLRQRLANECLSRHLPAGTVLVEPGQACQALPMVLQGTIDVIRQAGVASGKGHTREILLYRLLPGDSCVLTSGCLLTRRHFEARAVVSADAHLVLVPAALFLALTEQSPGFQRAILQLQYERLSELSALVCDVAFTRLDQRLAAALLGRGEALVITHQKLADELGSVREIVSRMLRLFEDRGWVRLERERIHVVDALALQQHAQALR